MKDKTTPENEYEGFEDWVNDNMMDSEPDYIEVTKQEEEADESPPLTGLSRLRGDSTMKPKISANQSYQMVLKALIAIATIFVIVLLFLKTQYSPVTVVGDSMYPTLQDGDILRTSTNIKSNLITYDTIICYSKNGKKTIIKRVVGLPGDTIEFKEGYIYINGVKREDDFPQMKEYPKETIVLGADEFYCLGDNRNNSRDSRFYGPTKLSEITNIVTFNSTQRKKDLQQVGEYIKQIKTATLTDATPTNSEEE